jgi:hypothetical protein
VVFGGRIGIDPCTAPDNPTDAEIFLTEADDGLAHQGIWATRDSMFANIPWSKALGMPPGVWLEPIHAFAMSHPFSQVIVVTAASTNASWFHKWLAPGDAHCFPRGRVEYERAPWETKGKNGVSFDSLVTYFGPQPDVFRRAYSDIGWCPRHSS